jgi:hypothetical protein
MPAPIVLTGRVGLPISHGDLDHLDVPEDHPWAATKAELAAAGISPAGRLIVRGDSFLACGPSPTGHGAPVNFNQSSAQNMIPDVLARLLGIDLTNRIVTYSFAAIATFFTTIAADFGPVPEDCFIEAVWVFPNAAFTGDSTDSRSYVVQASNPSSNGTLNWAVRTFMTGDNLVAHVPIPLLDLTLGRSDRKLLPQTAFNVLSGAIPMLRAVWWRQDQGSAPVASVFRFISQPLGSGASDPGGLVIVRLGCGLFNAAMGSSTLLESGISMGGWATGFYARMPCRYPGPEVNVRTPGAAAAATSIPCDGLLIPIPAGRIVTFDNGVTATVTAAAAFAATSLTVSALSGAVPTGSQGHARDSRAHGYEALIGHGLALHGHGRNDLAGAVTLERTGWKETRRALAAIDSCPYFTPAQSSNIVAVDGDGGGQWTLHDPPPQGQYIAPWANSHLGVRIFKGIPGTVVKTKLTIKLGPFYDGSPIDLFFLAQAGANHGGKATITADAAFNAGLACKINTTDACLNANVTTGLAGTITGGTTLTLTTGTFKVGTVDVAAIGMIDQAISGTAGTGAIAVGAKLAAVASATVATLDTASTNGTVTAVQTRGYVPMVKRLIGLPAGSRTATITVDSMAATDGSAEFIFMGYGIEATNPTNPVLIMGIALGPDDTALIANGALLDADTQAVIAGTATNPNADNSTEPPLHDGVKFVELQSVLNSDPTYFEADGVHPGTRGANKIATTLYTEGASQYTPEQLASR